MHNAHHTHAPDALGPAGNELCERMAYYGITFNLIVYLTSKLGVDNAQASSQVIGCLHVRSYFKQAERKQAHASACSIFTAQMTAQYRCTPRSGLSKKTVLL